MLSSLWIRNFVNLLRSPNPTNLQGFPPPERITLSLCAFDNALSLFKSCHVHFIFTRFVTVPEVTQVSLTALNGDTLRLASSCVRCVDCNHCFCVFKTLSWSNTGILPSALSVSLAVIPVRSKPISLSGFLSHHI